MTLTTDEAIAAYLKARNIPFTKIEALSGGTANYVWRITDHPDPSSPPATKAVKHAEPFVKSLQTLPFAVERMDFEAKALTHFPNPSPALSGNDGVQAAKLFWYDEEAHVMCMSDGGLKNLKSAYLDSEIDVVNAGRRLGEWLATFHAARMGGGELEMHSRESFDNKLAKSMHRYSYSNLAAAVEKIGLGEGEILLAKRIDEKFGSLLQTDDECICHGDFWPGTVLVSNSRDSALTIVDWEMVRRGCSATDVGQFAAEAWLLDEFRGGRGLCKAFVKSYVESLRASGSRVTTVEQAERLMQRVAVHFATHLAFWPAYGPAHVPWGNAEETRTISEWALSLAQAAMSGDLERLRSETFGGKFNPASSFRTITNHRAIAAQN